MSDATFQIELTPSGRRFEAAGSEPILNAAIRAGIAMPYGCRDGACGSCKGRLLQGRVEHGPHQDKALSAAEEAQGLILPCCARPLSDALIEARGVPAEGMHPVLRMPVRVLALERAAADVMLVTLQLPANQNFQYHAGQYLDMLLRDGARRSYSMATAPAHRGEPPTVQLHIRHMPGGKFTDQVFSTLKERDILRAEGPFGSFFLRSGDKPMVMLASGTGFAPIRGLIEHMQAEGIARPAVLYWGGRRPHDLYQREWIEARAAELPWLRFVPVVSDALPEDGWAGRSGFVHRAVMEDFADLSGHEVYACGAPVVVDAARRDFVAHCRLPEEAFFADSFITEADKARAAAA